MNKVQCRQFHEARSTYFAIVDTEEQAKILLNEIRIMFGNQIGCFYKIQDRNNLYYEMWEIAC